MTRTRPKTVDGGLSRFLLSGGTFGPTLLLDQRPATKQLCRFIRAVGRPRAPVLQKRQLRDVSCATVISTGEPLTDEWIVDDVIQVALAPSDGDFAAVNPQQLDDAGRELKAQLLRECPGR